jgi:hypothetical protein
MHVISYAGVRKPKVPQRWMRGSAGNAQTSPPSSSNRASGLLSGNPGSTPPASNQGMSFTQAAVLTVLVLAAVGSIWTGAISVTDREQPLVTLQAAADTNKNMMVTVDVEASGLRSGEQLLVQVVGLTHFVDVDKPRVSLCEQPWNYSTAKEEAGVTYKTLKEYQTEEAAKGAASDPKPADVLLWDRVGPDRTGAVQATIKIQIPTNIYKGVCAWAPLSDRGDPNPAKARNSVAYLRLVSRDSGCVMSVFR